jgi:hypothetical protein
MEAGLMSAAGHARRLLTALDQELTARVELTLYGRAALHLGFPDGPPEFGLSRDVDAILYTGQAEELAASTNFWQALDTVNRQYAGDGLYISHLFVEDQVILSPWWRTRRLPVAGTWQMLRLWRLGNTDLLLSKLMRDDPIDHGDALFIVRSAGLTASHVREAILSARIPAIPELEEQFALASARLLQAVGD